MENELFKLNNNIFSNNTVDNDSQTKVSIAEYLEDMIRYTVEQYEVAHETVITGADIMFKDGQVYVGPNSVKFNKKL